MFVLLPIGPLAYAEHVLLPSDCQEPTPTLLRDVSHIITLMDMCPAVKPVILKHLQDELGPLSPVRRAGATPSKGRDFGLTAFKGV